MHMYAHWYMTERESYGRHLGVAEHRLPSLSTATIFLFHPTNTRLNLPLGDEAIKCAVLRN